MCFAVPGVPAMSGAENALMPVSNLYAGVPGNKPQIRRLQLLSMLCCHRVSQGGAGGAAGVTSTGNSARALRSSRAAAAMPLGSPAPDLGSLAPVTALGSPAPALRTSRRAAADIMAPSAGVGSPVAPVAILDSSAWKPLLACAILQQIKHIGFRVKGFCIGRSEEYGLSQRLVTQSWQASDSCTSHLNLGT